jgi:bla regulator protein blaR1
VIVVALVSPSVAGQADPEFEVASVRPNSGDDTVTINRWTLRNGRLTLTNQTLLQLIARAYGPRLSSALRPERISGGPEWIGRERFSIQARMPEGIPQAQAESSMQSMLRRLLGGRFRLKVRIDRRDVSGYSLVMLRPGALGPQVRRSDVDCEAAQCGAGGGLAKYDARGIPMFMLARFLEEIVGAPVADDTGLDGGFDGLLQWSPAPEQLQRAGLDPADGARFSGPSIFTALQEQWGLLLRGARVPVDHVVIESAERPAPE